MTSTEQRQYIEKLYEAQAWHGQSLYAQRSARHFTLGTVYLHGWRRHRVWRTLSSPPATDMILRSSDKLDEVLSAVSIILWECSGVDAAHDHLIDVLATMQSNAVKRNRQREIGDVLFTLADTMFLFARANLVILVRNAGPNIFSLGEVAGSVDFAILRHLQKEENLPN